MNKHFLWLPTLLSIGIALYGPVKKATTPKIEDKSVSLTIYKAVDYNSPAYENSTAQVQIMIEKVNSKGQRTSVWSKTLSAESLKSYPSLRNAAMQNVVIPNINKKKEHLEVTYILLYNSKGTELRMQGGEVISETNHSVNIRI